MHLRHRVTGIFGARALFIFVVLVCASAIDAQGANTKRSSHLAIGTNLSGLVDWSPEHVFTDVFKMSRPWFSSHPLHWSTDLPVDLDENGWVKSLGKDQYARTMMLTGNEQPNFHPAGCFVILYNGEGKIGIFPQKILGSKPG